MQSNSIWDLKINLLTHSFHAERDAFGYAVESYREWVWLALESGSYEFRLGRDEWRVCNAGDWVICPPHEPLARRILATASYHFSRFVPDDAAAIQTLRGWGTLRDGGRAAANFRALRETPTDDSSREWKAHLLRDFFCGAAREKGLSDTISPRDAVMMRASSVLQSRFADPISLGELAREFRLSAPAFSRRFRAALGSSPQEFLLQTRLDHARTLLLQTDDTLDVIAGQCGLSNGFYLSRQWSKRHGIAPARFRRLHRV